jgi:hypothetical protein
MQRLHLGELRGLINVTLQVSGIHVTSRNFIPWGGAFHFVNSCGDGLRFGELEVGEGVEEQLLAELGFCEGVVGFGGGREVVNALAEVGSGGAAAVGVSEICGGLAAPRTP